MDMNRDIIHDYNHWTIKSIDSRLEMQLKPFKEVVRAKVSFLYASTRQLSIQMAAHTPGSSTLYISIVSRFIANRGISMVAPASLLIEYRLVEEDHLCNKPTYVIKIGSTEGIASIIDILLISFRVHLLRFKTRDTVDRLTKAPRSCQSQYIISSCWRQPSAIKYSNTSSVCLLAKCGEGGMSPECNFDFLL
jgi:hypothetical protein